MIDVDEIWCNNQHIVTLHLKNNNNNNQKAVISKVCNKTDEGEIHVSKYCSMCSDLRDLKTGPEIYAFKMHLLTVVQVWLYLDDIKFNWNFPNVWTSYNAGSPRSTEQLLTMKLGKLNFKKRLRVIIMYPDG